MNDNNKKEKLIKKHRLMKTITWRVVAYSISSRRMYCEDGDLHES